MQQSPYRGGVARVHVNNLWSGHVHALGGRLDLLSHKRRGRGQDIYQQGIAFTETVCV